MAASRVGDLARPRPGGLDRADPVIVEPGPTRGHLAVATVVDDLVDRAGRHLAHQLARQLPRLVAQLRSLLSDWGETQRYGQDGASVTRVLADHPLVRGAVLARLTGLCRVAVAAAATDLEDQDPGAVAQLWSLVPADRAGVASPGPVALAVALLDAGLLGTALSRQADRACATTTVVACAPLPESRRTAVVGLAP